MIVKNGICYPDDMAPVLKVVFCRAVGDSLMRVGFNNGDVRDFDVSPLFSVPALAPLGNPETLRNFALDHGVLTWLDGELDVAPEWLFDHGQPIAYPAVSVPPLSVAESGATFSPIHEDPATRPRGGVRRFFAPLFSRDFRGEVC